MEPASSETPDVAFYFSYSHPNLLDVFLVLAQLKWRVHDPGAVMKKVVLFAQD